MAAYEESDILEGFLCPICKIDLATIDKLHTHFHLKHEEDLDVLKFFKGVVGQAKKILKSNKDDDKKDFGFSLDSYFDPFQDVGVTRSHIEDFKVHRTNRLEGYAVETNKIIIRLDRLLTNMPTDTAKKKMHEQTVVPWLDGENVKRCPNCTKQFHMARRQHHCRLCGSIMCNECSQFLPIYKAKQVLSKPSEDDISDETKGNDSTERSLRLCGYCITLLENREQMKASRNFNPMISQLYDNLREHVITIDKHSELYYKMSVSLNLGESKYNLNDARELWHKILKLAETVEQCSAKIATLGVNDSKNPPSEKQLMLQKAIRSGTTSYIRCRILNLPSVPTDEKYTEMQNNRRRRIEEQIREQKSESPVNHKTFKTESVEFKPSTMIKSQVTSEGWIPENINLRRNDDPLIEQITNIRHYIKQAREALKFDEVASLEQHLAELQEEYAKKFQETS